MMWIISISHNSSPFSIMWKHHVNVLQLKALSSIFLLLFVYFLLLNIFSASILVYFFNILQCCLVSYIIKENHVPSQNQEKCMACCTPNDLHCNFLCQYPIEIPLSITWKSVVNILWFLKKSFSFLAALLHNLTINFIYKSVFQCVETL